MKNSKYVMWFVKNKNVTMLHNLLRNLPVMMEASSLHDLLGIGIPGIVFFNGIR
jgi:hypothetical protein